MAGLLNPWSRSLSNLVECGEAEGGRMRDVTTARAIPKPVYLPRACASRSSPPKLSAQWVCFCFDLDRNQSTLFGCSFAWTFRISGKGNEHELQRVAGSCGACGELPSSWGCRASALFNQKIPIDVPVSYFATTNTLRHCHTLPQNPPKTPFLYTNDMQRF